MSDECHLSDQWIPRCHFRKRHADVYNVGDSSHFFLTILRKSRYFFRLANELSGKAITPMDIQ